MTIGPFQIRGWCNWRELLPRGDWNWRNFNLVGIGVEVGTYKGRYVEINVEVLNTGFTVEWFDRNTRAVFLADMDQRMAEAKELWEGAEDD